MIDETRKRLTVFIDECWHESIATKQGFPNVVGVEPYCVDVCTKCKVVLSNSYQAYVHNRTFSTPDDAQVVKDKLVEKGLWEEFILFADQQFPSRNWEDFIDKLFSYTRDSSGNVTGYRLCELAGEFTKTNPYTIKAAQEMIEIFKSTK